MLSLVNSTWILCYISASWLRPFNSSNHYWTELGRDIDKWRKTVQKNNFEWRDSSSGATEMVSFKKLLKGSQTKQLWSAQLTSKCNPGGSSLYSWQQVESCVDEHWGSATEWHHFQGKSRSDILSTIEFLGIPRNDWHHYQVFPEVISCHHTNRVFFVNFFLALFQVVLVRVDCWWVLCHSRTPNNIANKSL